MVLNVSLCNEIIRDLDFRQQCRFARAVGYDGLELAPFTLSQEPHRLGSADIRRLRDTATDEGVAISGLHWLLAAPKGLSITSADKHVIETTRMVGRALVRLTGELGASYVVHGSPAQRHLEAGREADGKSRALAYFAEMARASEEAGIDYCLEPLTAKTTNFITCVDEAARIVAEIGSPALGTMIDCCAAAQAGEDVATLIRRWLPRGLIRHIHFNDPNLRGPGEGELDFGPIAEALTGLAYKGVIGVEPFVYEPDGRSCAARAIGYVHGLLARTGHGAPRPRGLPGVRGSAAMRDRL